MPYWTAFGGSNEWTGGSPLRLVFTGRRYGYEAPVTGSLRLLALRRGQQDAELLSLLAGRPGYDRWRIARSVRHHLNMARDLEAAGADDPGRLTFTHLTPADLHALRLALLRELGTEQEPGNRELRTRPPGQ